MGLASFGDSLAAGDSLPLSAPIARTDSSGGLAYPRSNLVGVLLLGFMAGGGAEPLGPGVGAWPGGGGPDGACAIDALGSRDPGPGLGPYSAGLPFGLAILSRDTIGPLRCWSEGGFCASREVRPVGLGLSALTFLAAGTAPFSPFGASTG